MSYIEIIKTAVLVFPVIAFLITAPYMLFEYHKYGSIHPYKTGITYSFILYLLIAYFLIILPLPDRNEVALLTTPRFRLEPFAFITDFINDSGLVLTDLNTYGMVIKKSCFFVPVYNILLCMPFGIYLHYYFKCNFKKTVLFTFLLSLFFELTQLSGLYFIYPRGYRLFDIDDLFLNTMGGLIGYYIAYLFIKFLPSRDKIDKESLELGKKVSFIKRITVSILDMFIVFLIDTLLFILIKKSFFIILCIVYFIILPYFMNGKTLGKMFLNLRVTSNDDKKLSLWRIFLREVLLIITYFVIPFIFIYVVFLIGYNMKFPTNIEYYIIIGTGLILFIYYLVILIKLIRKKSLMYELISHTKVESTILTKV